MVNLYELFKNKRNEYYIIIENGKHRLLKTLIRWCGDENCEIVDVLGDKFIKIEYKN